MEFPAKVNRPLATALLAGAMIALIVGLDLTCFRGQAWTWERLAANFGVVLVFGAFYFRFIGRH